MIVIIRTGARDLIENCDTDYDTKIYWIYNTENCLIENPDTDFIDTRLNYSMKYDGSFLRTNQKCGLCVTF